MASSPPSGLAMKSPLARASTYLQENHRICELFQHHKRYPRCIVLERQSIFNNLVQLYTMWFKINWHQFCCLVESNMTPPYNINTGASYAARVLVSGWFNDLYVVNRSACKKLCILSYNQHYRLDIVSWSNRYDPFLAELLGMLKPTHIKLIHEDSLFIPLITSQINEEASEANQFDYFGITNWAYNLPLFLGILQLMEERKLAKLMDVTDNAEGRPFWLFDWHDDVFYAWFPSQENYNMEDACVAYVVGTACSSALGPRDYDDWQNLPSYVRPQDINVNAYNRVRNLVYSGAETYRTFQVQTLNLNLPTPAPAQGTSSSAPQQEKRKRGSLPKKQKSSTEEAENTSAHVTSSQSSLQAIQETRTLEEAETEEHIVFLEEPHPQGVTSVKLQQIQIVDFIYHRRLLLRADFDTRYAAFQMIIGHGRLE